MTATIDPRRTQTRVKHIILQRYLARWGGIIIAGHQGVAAQRRLKGQSTDLHFVYVDCNASIGRYAGEQEDVSSGMAVTPVYGSPIIGIQELARLVIWGDQHGVNVKTNAILIEKDRGRFEELKNSLEMNNLQHRLQFTREFSTLRNSEIAVLCADSTEVEILCLTVSLQASDSNDILSHNHPLAHHGAPLRRTRSTWRSCGKGLACGMSGAGIKNLTRLYPTLNY
jgi:hypothetical protein